jgi:hypothetical protein
LPGDQPNIRTQGPETASDVKSRITHLLENHWETAHLASCAAARAAVDD